MISGPGEAESIACGGILRGVGNCRPAAAEWGTRQHQGQQVADPPAPRLLLQEWCQLLAIVHLLNSWLTPCQINQIFKNICLWKKYEPVHQIKCLFQRPHLFSWMRSVKVLHVQIIFLVQLRGSDICNPGIEVTDYSLQCQLVLWKQRKSYNLQWICP